jgi:hypothetical protein
LPARAAPEKAQRVLIEPLAAPARQQICDINHASHRRSVSQLGAHTRYPGKLDREPVTPRSVEPTPAAGDRAD